MKVVHSCTSESYSGLEAYVIDLVEAQHKAGHDVELFCRAGTRLETEARARGIATWLIGRDSRPGPALWVDVHRGWKRRYTTGECVLHMHAGGEPKFHLPALVGRRLAKRILHYHIWINHKKRDPLHRALYALIDEVWTSSESARAHLARILPVKLARIRVMPYARDVEALEGAPRARWREDVRARLGLTSDARVAICISRIEPIKGTRELFDAFVAVAPQRPHAHLVFIGGASPADAGAEALERELAARRELLPKSVSSRMHFPGFVSPCEAYLAAADFYVLPTYQECMSLAMLDAAIMGLPVIGTDSGGTPSIVRPGETGELVPPQDVPALSRALERFFDDDALCKRLGESARQLCRKFGRKEVFARLWAAYSEPQIGNDHRPP